MKTFKDFYKVCEIYALNESSQTQRFLNQELWRRRALRSSPRPTKSNIRVIPRSPRNASSALKGLPKPPEPEVRGSMRTPLSATEVRPSSGPNYAPTRTPLSATEVRPSSRLNYNSFRNAEYMRRTDARLQPGRSFAANRELTALGNIVSPIISFTKQASLPLSMAQTILNTSNQEANAKQFQNKTGVRQGELYKSSDILPGGKVKPGAIPQISKIENYRNNGDTFGKIKGSGISGIGGNTVVSKNNKGSSFISTGTGSQRKTTQLPSTQLVRDNKTNKQYVGNLAFSGGKPTYIRRPTPSLRDAGFFGNLSRETGIGNQRQKDASLAKQEYKTALKNTQSYQKNLGITPDRAKQLKLPGR